MNMLHKAMTIAGSDASGGAGMEADLKTFQELDVFPIIIEGRFHESKEKYEIPVKSTRVYLTASIKIGIM